MARADRRTTPGPVQNYTPLEFQGRDELGSNDDIPDILINFEDFKCGHPRILPRTPSSRLEFLREESQTTKTLATTDGSP